MSLTLIIEIIYILIVLAVAIKVILDTDDSVKAAAYILLLLLLPVAGIFIYLSFGINYRKNEIYSKKLFLNKNQSRRISGFVETYHSKNIKKLEEAFPRFYELNQMFPEDPLNFATMQNEASLLVNGEKKFPEMLQAIKNAKHHIHLEYYIYENDKTGNEIADRLIEKSREGVKIRFIYDDFGSRSIRKTIVPRLRNHGIEAYPFYKITFIRMANRMNYRNHRKIIVIDGEIAFVGGINISDKYDNSKQKKLFWRDTHLKLRGEATWRLQHIFMADWNFCSGENLKPDNSYFKEHKTITSEQWTQIISSGPDSETPEILYSILHAIYNAKENIYLTTPYFIPTKELLTALIMAAQRGLVVCLLVPGISDSFFVNAVSKSYYGALLQSGVRVYLYQKGFVHAKTIVCDQRLSIVGTANLDHRSFELNFEVNAVIYDSVLAQQLSDIFLKDTIEAELLDPKTWKQRSFGKRFLEKAIRLIGPLM